MKHIVRWLLLVLTISGLQLSACSPGASTAQKTQPFKLEAVEGTELKRVVLTEKAAERLDLQTVPVHSQMVNGSERKVIPYGAVIYDVQGQTWAYVSRETLVFMREPIDVESLDGDLAILTSGPELGIPVVTVGAAELYGAELGVSK